MTTSDGQVVGVTKIVDHGPDNARWNLVIMGDGYQTGQLAQYHNDVQSFVTTLFATAPFGDLQSAINVHRVDVSSTDAGADDPTACGGSGATARTYFDASFCNGGIRRLLEVNNTTALTVAANQVPQFHMAMVVVNSSVYGGSGGSVATFSLAAGANEIGLHEMGHTAFGFADEYEYWAGCGVDADRNRHPATEPTEPNVTVNANRATNKWRDLVAASTAMPTTTNADCTKCDPQANPVSASTVGAFEGAHYYHCGAYRPQYTCRMRALSNPFCAVCQRVIRQKLTPFLPQVPSAVADPAPYAFVAESKEVVEQHNLFRTGDGHIHALWFNFATGWHHEDRTAMLPGVPPAVETRRRTPSSRRAAVWWNSTTCSAPAMAISTRCGSTSPLAGTTRTAPRCFPASRRPWETRRRTPSSRRAAAWWSSTTCSVPAMATSTRCGSTSPLAGTMRTAPRCFPASRRPWETRRRTPSSRRAAVWWSSTTCSAPATAISTRCGSTSPLAGTMRTAPRCFPASRRRSAKPVAVRLRRGEQRCGGAAQLVPHRRWSYPRVVVQLRHWLAP